MDKEQYYNVSEDIMNIIKPYLKNDAEKIDEDFMIKEKNNNEFANKSEDKELSVKKINNIAGLLNKLDKKDLKKIIDLLEVN